MDPLTILDVLSRWVHVGTAVVLVGGSVFMRYVLMPAAGASLGEAEHEALRGQLIVRWKKYVMIGIALLLVTGFYNYIKVAIPQHKGDGLYHGLMGIKILLGIAVFFLGSVLVGRSPKFEGLRQNRAKWLSVLILLSAIVIALGGVLKVAVPGTRAAGVAPALLENPPQDADAG
jgi:uncharacterized membrane protein